MHQLRRPGHTGLLEPLPKFCGTAISKSATKPGLGYPQCLPLIFGFKDHKSQEVINNIFLVPVQILLTESNIHRGFRCKK